MTVLNKREEDIKNGFDGGGDYQESLKSVGGNASSVGGKAYTPPKDNSSYYEALKNESYSTLLQSEIQASIARDQAMKYTQGQLNAQGYGTQGLSASSEIGLHNNYMGALNQAQSDYRNSLLGIKQQEQNAKEEQFQQLATLMEGAESTENLGRLFDAYGISVDENGNLGGNYFNSLDPQSQAQLKYLYDSYNKSYGTAENEEKQQAFIEKYAVADYIGSGIEAGTPISDARLNETIRKFDTNDVLKDMQSGDVVEVVDGKNTSYMVNNNGQWYYISKEGYQNATGTKYTASKDGIYSEQGQKDFDSFKNRFGINSKTKTLSISELSPEDRKQLPNLNNYDVYDSGIGYYVFYDNKFYKISKEKFEEQQQQNYQTNQDKRNAYRTELAKAGKY